MRFIEIHTDRWRTPGGDAGSPTGADAGPHRLLELPQWQAARAQWPAALPVGVRMANDHDVEDIAQDLPRIALLVLHFPKWTDGRAYSQARLLRSRHRFNGEIRATGDVVVDMLPLLARTGFDAVQLRADQAILTAQRALGFFSGHYQADVSDHRPRFALPHGKAEAHTPGGRIAHALSLLQDAADGHRGRIVQATSLGAEDMVVTDLIARHQLGIGVATLETGQLHDETVALIPRIGQRYGLAVEVFKPVHESVLHFVRTHGERAMYDSVALRKACCAVRKLEPLSRMLAGRSAWVTGLRREQSNQRGGVPTSETDDAGRVKFNPIAVWSWADVWH